MGEEETLDSHWTENSPVFTASPEGGEGKVREQESDLDVVFGAATPLGESLVRNLANAGRRVRAVMTNREFQDESVPGSVEVWEGNPLDSKIVEEMCDGVATIYLCLEFQHHDWKNVAQRILNNVVCYAIERSVRVFLALPLFDAKGFRNNFDEQTLDAQREGFTEVLVARLPQLYGPGLRNTLFDAVYDSILSDKKKAHWVGSLDIPRDFLYIEDAGRACASLGLSPMAYGRTWDISTGTPVTGRQFIEYAASLAGKTLELGIWQNRLLRVAGVLDFDSKQVAELPYDYSRPMVVDGTDFMENFPGFEFTPIDAGMTEVFDWYRNFLKPHNLLQKYLPLNSLPV
jgi:nucleoside-diphosphate-sugar epimerase